ncbi:MAG TPA: GyrI-like domain-containing protein [Xanthobacteraceae bacterium]|nr:GyrI-like domain-containing protein [Xanthobacteraceae bacterium]
MPLRLARAGLVGAALAAILGSSLPQTAFAQNPAPAAPAQAQPQNPAPPTTPPAAATAPAAPEQIAPGSTPAQPGDVFGENTTLTARPMIYVKGSGTWDKTFDIITTSLKKIKAYLDKEGIKPDGPPMTIFTASDDNGFDYEIGLPIAAAPKNPPHGEFTVGQTPDGAALKFVYRGSYDDLDNTYETITDYLDEKRLDAKEMIEEYVTDPLTAGAGKLVINVYVLIKPPDASPG